MNQIIVLNSINKNSTVKIENGELISYTFNGDELMHQKGMPGWRNSDTEMFPLIGPTEANNFKVATPKGNYSQDQHGLLRELNYAIENKTDYTCSYIKKYAAYTAVENSKFPEKSPVKLLSWPYKFSFRKSFELTNEELKITFEIESEIGMPFMLGYHPAFKLEGNNMEIVSSITEEISIPKIMDQGSVGLPFLNTCEIHLKKENGLNILIKTKIKTNFK